MRKIKKAGDADFQNARTIYALTKKKFPYEDYAALDLGRYDMFFQFF